MKKLSFEHIASLRGRLTSYCCKAVSEDEHALYRHTPNAPATFHLGVLDFGILLRVSSTACKKPNFLGAAHGF